MKLKCNSAYSTRSVKFEYNELTDDHELLISLFDDDGRFEGDIILGPDDVKLLHSLLSGNNPNA